MHAIITNLCGILIGCLYGHSHWMWSTEDINDNDIRWLLPRVISHWRDAGIQKGTGSLWYYIAIASIY